jgi:hypothetical protein
VLDKTHDDWNVGSSAASGLVILRGDIWVITAGVVATPNHVSTRGMMILSVLVSSVRKF